MIGTLAGLTYAGLAFGTMAHLGFKMGRRGDIVRSVLSMALLLAGLMVMSLAWPLILADYGMTPVQLARWESDFYTIWSQGKTLGLGATLFVAAVLGVLLWGIGHCPHCSGTRGGLEF